MTSTVPRRSKTHDITAKFGSVNITRYTVHYKHVNSAKSQEVRPTDMSGILRMTKARNPPCLEHIYCGIGLDKFRIDIIRVESHFSFNSTCMRNAKQQNPLGFQQTYTYLFLINSYTDSRLLYA